MADQRSRDQLGLFDVRTHVRRSHTDTEAGAAADALQDAPAASRRVLRYLRAIYPQGATDPELVATLNMHSARRRRADLKNLGLVEDSGNRRNGPRGKPMIVWRATS